MLNRLEMPPVDKILSLMPIFSADPRPEKIDLGVGVYKNAAGNTPIFRAVAEAERRVLAGQATKGYVGPGGDPRFCAAMTQVVFGDGAPPDRIAAVQTTGGAGALTVLAGLVSTAKPGARIHVPDPTWVNHHSILTAQGLAVTTYPYFDAASGLVDFPAILHHLTDVARPDDVVLLHGCCHNPTGANLSPAQWRQIADILLDRDLLPFVDFAYQGFGDGLDEDAFAVRLFAARLPRMLVASSCSKNFGIYRERTGTAFALAATPAEAAVSRAQLVLRNRIAYSMPPDHGSAIVRTILEDGALTEDWRAELADIRQGIVETRELLANTFKRLTNSDRYEFLRAHKGMFSLIGVTPAQVERLRSEFAIYMVEDSRINLAGLRRDQIERFAKAVLAVQA